MKAKGGLSWPPVNVEEKNTMFNAAISVLLINIRNRWYRFLLEINLFLYQNTLHMKLTITIKYFHPALNIGLEDVRNAWLLNGHLPPVKLKTIIHQSLLSYRLPVSGKRISYRTLKKGLIRKQIIIHQPFELLPF